MTDLSATPPSGPVARLPVFQTVADAYRFTLQRIGQVLTAAIVPFGISMSLVVLNVGTGGTLSHFTMLLDLFAYAVFAVAWHRALLVGEAPSLIPRLGYRQLRFWLMSLLIPLILVGLVAVPAVVLGYLAGGEASAVGLFLLPLVLCGLYVAARFSFVFPASAVDERFGLGASWRTTAGNAWRLIGAYLLASLPMLLAVVVLLALSGPMLGFGGLLGGTGEAVGPATGGALGILAIVAFSVVNYIFAAVFVSLLSLSFRTCTGWVPHSGHLPPGGSAPRDDGSGDARYH
ncbi:hypothetical protein ABWI00_15820 [Algihabitans albus]|uniref:hypothetical protein n=1 Tax=Algihabitans albus TaxID=2164067 RepID=UPI0035CF519D